MVNLGAGHGYSVLEVIEAFAMASRRNIGHDITQRRCVDIAASYATTGKDKSLLGWGAERTLSICVLTPGAGSLKNLMGMALGEIKVQLTPKTLIS